MTTLGWKISLYSRCPDRLQVINPHIHHKGIIIIIIIIYSFGNLIYKVVRVGMERERSVLDVVQEVSYPDRRGDEAGQRDA